jgi:hypothetical protein
MTSNRTDRLHVSVASVRDRDELVAELWGGDVQVAELAILNGQLVLQLYAPPRPSGWNFEYSEFLHALEEMKRELER